MTGRAVVEVSRERDGTGPGRSLRLLRLFRSEQGDPGLFYGTLAEDTVRQVADYREIRGATVVDVGGGGGWFTAAFRARGARCCLIEPDRAELLSRPGPRDGTSMEPNRRSLPGAVQGDGLRLPLRDGATDITFSSNVLEHVPDPQRMIAELIRVTRKDGLIYLAFTNWYSPWGGHEMSPWHYLGAGLAERRYARRYGREASHKVGASLFRVHVGSVLRALRARDDIELTDARPRYYPAWCRGLVRVPGLREVATWNLMLVMRRTR
jgi:SAM-dependent methyltransferase